MVQYNKVQDDQKKKHLVVLVRSRTNRFFWQEQTIDTFRNAYNNIWLKLSSFN